MYTNYILYTLYHVGQLTVGTNPIRIKWLGPGAAGRRDAQEVVGTLGAVRRIANVVVPNHGSICLNYTST